MEPPTAAKHATTTNSLTRPHPQQLQNRVAFYALPASHLRVLVALLQQAPTGNQVRASIARIADYSRMSPRSVQYAMNGRRRANGEHIAGLLALGIVAILQPAEWRTSRPATLQVNERALERLGIDRRMVRYLRRGPQPGATVAPAPRNEFTSPVHTLHPPFEPPALKPESRPRASAPDREAQVQKPSCDGNGNTNGNSNRQHDNSAYRRRLQGLRAKRPHLYTAMITHAKNWRDARVGSAAANDPPRIRALMLARNLAQQFRLPLGLALCFVGFTDTAIAKIEVWASGTADAHTDAKLTAWLNSTDSRIG